MQAVDLVGLDLQFAGIFMFQQSGLQPVQETGQDIGADIGSPERVITALERLPPRRIFAWVLGV